MEQLTGFGALAAARTVLLAELSAGLSADQVLPAMQRLEEFRHSLAQADHLLIQALETFALAERHCVSSAEKLVAQVLSISPGDARRRVRAAAAVGPRRSMLGDPLPPRRPVLAAAQIAGAVSPLAVDLIERTLTTVELLAPAEVDATEQVLTAQARVFEPTELARICERLVEHVDPDGSRPREAIRADRRFLTLGRCADGMTKLEGRLTPAASARVRAVLEPLAAPRRTAESGPHGGERVVPDPRTREQRLHDALDEGCARLLRSGDVPAAGGVPASVIITIDAEQLLQAATAGAGAGARAGTVEVATGEVLSVREALVLATEAEIFPVVLGAGGRPLHFGRTRRLATASQTYALIARDGGCSFPGCTVPPQWCERHHLVPWSAGGGTDIDNLTLLCGYHHGHFVQAGWTAVLDADGLPEWRPPRWLDRGRTGLVNHRIRRRRPDRDPRSVAGARSSGSDPPGCDPPSSRPPGPGGPGAASRSPVRADRVFTD